MLGMSFFSRPKISNKPVSTYRPRVDELETRLCPAGSSLSLSAQVLPGHMVQLSGTVHGAKVADVTVNFSGAAVGSTTTDANGAYSYTTSSANLGSVTAVDLDSNGNPIATAKSAIAVADPAVTLSITYGAGNSVTLSGTLTDIDAGGETIVLRGVAAGSVVTDSAGNFSLTTDASAVGAIDAATTDLWGTASNTAEVMVARDAPIIENFAAEYEGFNLWHFSGHVNTSDPQGMTIRFGGLNGELAGRTTTVGADGNFDVAFFLSENVLGTASAITTDGLGQDSALAFYPVG